VADAARALVSIHKRKGDFLFGFCVWQILAFFFGFFCVNLYFRKGKNNG
jgi:hypothetical protein